MGQEIDRNIVVRLKDPSWQDKKDYGERVDYMVASTETMLTMLDYKRVPKEYWAQPKRGTWNAHLQSKFEQRAKAPLRIFQELFLRWNDRFKELRSKDVPNFSVGVAAIVFLCDQVRPSEIRLVGFDNLLTPNVGDYFKANKGKWVTHHDWKAENQMLPLIEAEYGVKIVGMG